MKPWANPPQMKKEEQKPALVLECIYGPHKADVLHRGTAYCRSCYEEKARLGKLLDQ